MPKCNEVNFQYITTYREVNKIQDYMSFDINIKNKIFK